MATSDGSLYVGNIDPRDGGECRITKEFKLFSGPGDFIHNEEMTAHHVSHVYNIDNFTAGLLFL